MSSALAFAVTIPEGDVIVTFGTLPPIRIQAKLIVVLSPTPGSIVNEPLVCANGATSTEVDKIWMTAAVPDARPLSTMVSSASYSKAVPD